MITVIRWHRRCPAYTPPGPCRQPYEDEKNCQVFTCTGCTRRVPWCFGGSDSELCNDCWVKGTVT